MKLGKTLLAAFLSATMISGSAFAQASYQHIRNATGKLAYNDTVFLIDPMLAEKGRYDGFAGTFNSELRNPMVELPETKDDVLQDVDAIVITHTHSDHWDEVAQQFINKDIPVFVQDKKDFEAIKKEGFRNVQILDRNVDFQGVTLKHIEGTHGTEAMYEDNHFADAAGETMGVIFSAPGEKTTYLMGDTVWTARITKTLHTEKPQVIIMNTGYAKLLGYNDGIIMGTEDVAKAARLMPGAKLITVHMDAINHCTVSRSNMRNFIQMADLSHQVFVPNDGESIQLDE